MMALRGLGVVRSNARSTAAHATIVRNNLEVLRNLVNVLRARDRTQIELEALRAELLEAETTIASLVADLEHERAHVAYLEERLAEFEDAAEAARRSRPALRIVSITREPMDPGSTRS
jgi:chromosome segregation ATPase